MQQNQNTGSVSDQLALSPKLSKNFFACIASGIVLMKCKKPIKKDDLINLCKDGSRVTRATGKRGTIIGFADCDSEPFDDGFHIVRICLKQMTLKVKHGNP